MEETSRVRESKTLPNRVQYTNLAIRRQVALDVENIPDLLEHTMPWPRPPGTTQNDVGNAPHSPTSSFPPSPPLAAPDDDDSSSENPQDLSSAPQSRAGSQVPEDGDPEAIPEDSVTCQWDDCGIVFTHLPTLIDHIHNGEFERLSRKNFQ